MLKITKKEVRDLLKDAKEVHPLGWTMARCGVFIYNNNVNTFITWQGQSMNEIIYNGEYDDIVYLESFCDEREYDLKTATDLAYEYVVAMIDQHNGNILAEYNNKTIDKIYEGMKWSEVKELLEGNIIVDRDNVDKVTGGCIVDFKGEYSNLSINGKIVDTDEEIIVKIDDEEIIYRNN